VDHHSTHEKEIIEDGAFLVVKEAIDPEAAEPGHDAVCSAPEEIYPRNKKDRIEDTGDEDPLPEPVCPDEVVRFAIGLEGYNDLF
jgi:hypothetical protein